MLDQAATGQLSLTAALERLLAIEVDATEARRLAGRLVRQPAHPRHPGRLRRRRRRGDPHLIDELATCHYLESATNILLVGPPLLAIAAGDR